MKLVLFLSLVLLVPAARAQPAGAVPPSGEAKTAAPKKAPARRAKKAPAKAKKKVPESKYKTTKLSESLDEHYRFDEDGNPIDVKKPAAKAKTKPSSDESDDKPACSSGDSCSDADAL